MKEKEKKTEFDEVSITANNYEGFTSNDIVKRLKEAYKMVLIGDEEHPTKGNDTALFVTPPEKRERTVKNVIFKSDSFKILVSKRFILNNKSGFLGLLAKLISNNIIRFIRGGLSYETNGKFIFINLNNALESKDKWFSQKVCQNYDNIKCLFKHKYKDIATIFWETKTKRYSFGEEQSDSQVYDFVYADNESEYPLPLALMAINTSGNVKIEFAYEKLSILTTVIYAKDLDDGLDILKEKMKNLGLDVKLKGRVK